MTDSLAEPHSHNLRHHRQMEGPGFFLSLSASTLASRPIDDRVASEVCAALCFYAAKKLIALAAFVVMFDHWHAQLATWDGMTISKCMKLLDRWIGRQTDGFLLASGCAWQDGFHDTRIRSAKQFRFVCSYIEENPVRAGFVESPSDWKWSSAHPNYQSSLTKPWPSGFEKV